MKIKSYSILLVVFAFAFLFSNNSRADLANPIVIVNGKSTTFSTDTANNWYEFTLGGYANVLFLGSDLSGSDISTIKIYNESLLEVVSDNWVLSESYNLPAGKYLVNISDSRGGTVTIYSNQLTNPLVPNPPKGSIVNPVFPQNGASSSFSSNVETNVFHFVMKASGNLLVSGSDLSGSDISTIKIYNESLLEVVSDNWVLSESYNLPAGKYYLVAIDSRGGTVTIYSNQLGNPSYPLTVIKKGDGSGTVTSNSPGINCGNICSYNFNNGSTVILTAKAGNKSVFKGWSGACSGYGTCAITMDRSKSVIATFGKQGKGLNPGIIMLLKKKQYAPLNLSFTVSTVPGLSNNFDSALDINNTGQISGSFTNSTAFFYDPINGVTNIGALGSSYGTGWGINDSAQVVGDAMLSTTCTTGSCAFIWDSTNGMSSLGSLTDSDNHAYDINDSGVVVGFSINFKPEYYIAFLWDSVNGMQDLGTLPTYTYSIANAINNSGQVVGSSTNSLGIKHAFVWDAANGMKDLGTLGGGASIAEDINNQGYIVGYSQVATGENHGFVYTPTGSMQDLNSLLSTTQTVIIEGAKAINDSGQILAYGKINGTHYNAIVLSPK